MHKKMVLFVANYFRTRAIVEIPLQKAKSGVLGEATPTDPRKKERRAMSAAALKEEGNSKFKQGADGMPMGCRWERIRFGLKARTSRSFLDSGVHFDLHPILCYDQLD